MAPSSPVADPWTGRLVGGRWRIVSLLDDSGGMANVYLAEDENLPRRAAVKIPKHAAFNEEFRQRFTREAFWHAKVENPHVVAILDRGEEEGTPFLVLQFLSGGNLKSWCASQPALLSQPALHHDRWLSPIAQALDAVWQQGIVHRDVKPSNILFDASGRGYLSDFGIVRAASDKTLTSTGMFIGTLQFMSPEQCQQDKSQPIDGRSDQYGLAVTLYQVLTGWRYPAPDDTAVIYATKLGFAPPIPPTTHDPRIPRAVEAVILRALATHREDRFGTCVQFVDEVLDAFGHLAGPRTSAVAPAADRRPADLAGPVEAAVETAPRRSWPTAANPSEAAAPAGAAPSAPPPKRPRVGFGWLVAASVGVTVASVAAGLVAGRLFDPGRWPETVAKGRTALARLDEADAPPSPHTALKIVAPDLDPPAPAEPAVTPAADSPAVSPGPQPSELAVIGRRPFDDGASASLAPAQRARPVPEPMTKPPGQRDYEEGRRLLHGEGVPIDRDQAFQSFKRAADQGHPVACTFVAGALAGGWGGNAAGQYGEADAWNRRALKDLRRLAALGDADALLALGRLHLEGVVVTRDVDRARSLMRLAAEAGHPHAHAELALELAADAETETDKAEVFRLLARAVDLGSVAGMTALGQAHELGTNGAEQDEAEAFRLLREAALKNDDGAVHSLAHMTQDGRGTAKDETLAVRLFVHALGLSPGCDCRHAVCLANCYFDGVGGEKDAARGIAILAAAAETNAAAMLELADRIANGRGVKQDTEKAAGWYRRALTAYRKLAERGDDRSAIIVGRFHASGAGVPRDPAEARRWFERARRSPRASIVREAIEAIDALDRGDGST